jgi:ubiquinone/menaquinone biosynthesis C-methylase UbiE
MTMLKKVAFHLRRGTLLRKTKTVILKRLYGKNAIPIGHDYIGEKAEDYDRDREGGEYWMAEQESMARFLGRVQGVRTVLDAPFGTGRFCPIYAEHRLEVVALDISADMIDQARRKHPEVMARAKVLVQDMRRIDYADNALDLVVCYRFLPWIVSYEEAELSLKELARVCGQYAILELCVGQHPTGSGRVVKNRTLWNRLNEEELRSWLRKYGLEVMEVVPLFDDYWHPGLTAFLCRKIRPALGSRGGAEGRESA